MYITLCHCTCKKLFKRKTALRGIKKIQPFWNFYLVPRYNNGSSEDESVAHGEMCGPNNQTQKMPPFLWKYLCAYQYKYSQKHTQAAAHYAHKSTVFQCTLPQQQKRKTHNKHTIYYSNYNKTILLFQLVWYDHLQQNHTSFSVSLICSFDYHNRWPNSRVFFCVISCA